MLEIPFGESVDSTLPSPLNRLLRLNLSRHVELEEFEEYSDIILEDEFQECLEEATSGLAGLAAKLYPDLLEGRWDFIIGDDASGRLPALFVKDLADNLSPRFKQSSRTRLFFVAGGYEPDSLRRYDDLREVGPRVSSLPFEPGARGLVVTEVCTRGLGMGPTFKALREQGYGADLATVYTYTAADNIRRILTSYAGVADGYDLFIGDVDHASSTLNTLAKASAGVHKIAGQAICTYSETGTREMTLAAREFIKNYASEIAAAGR